MWAFFADKIVYQDTNPVNDLPYFLPDFSSFSGEILRVTTFVGDTTGYDDWVSRFSREEEVALVAHSIAAVTQDPSKRLHIVGVSTNESIELLRDYYAECGYEDDLAKDYRLPLDVRLTVSLNLCHILWCEKDKHFLQKQRFFDASPPMRSPADLRSLQQAVRMGIIAGIELQTHEIPFLSQIFDKQVCTLFTLSQMLAFRWSRYGFPGEINVVPFILPSLTP